MVLARKTSWWIMSGGIGATDIDDQRLTEVDVNKIIDLASVLVQARHKYAETFVYRIEALCIPPLIIVSGS
jgi:hypothetical protein